MTEPITAPFPNVRSYQLKHAFRKCFILALALILSLFGCTSVTPHIVNGVTPPPAVVDSVEPTGDIPASDLPAASREPFVTAEPTPGPNVDALGNPIDTSDHFERYISFSNIIVYEENGDTFVDCTVHNSYPELLLCAVNIDFYSETGELIANGSLQMPDGSFLLALENGDTPLYAKILTDIVLTDKEFVLRFDPQTGVMPQ